MNLSATTAGHPLTRGGIRTQKIKGSCFGGEGEAKTSVLVLWMLTSHKKCAFKMMKEYPFSQTTTTSLSIGVYSV